MLAICDWDGLSNPVPARGEGADPGDSNRLEGRGRVCSTRLHSAKGAHATVVVVNRGFTTASGCPVLNVGVYL